MFWEPNFFIMLLVDMYTGIHSWHSHFLFKLLMQLGLLDSTLKIKSKGIERASGTFYTKLLLWFHPKLATMWKCFSFSNTFPWSCHHHNHLLCNFKITTTKLYEFWHERTHELKRLPCKYIWKSSSHHRTESWWERCPELETCKMTMFPRRCDEATHFLTFFLPTNLNRKILI